MSERASFRFFLPALIIVSAGSCPAQNDLPQGLSAEYSDGMRTVRRIDRSLGFDWGSYAPDPRLSSGQFNAVWKGSLLSRAGGAHTFHVFVAGSATVMIDGETVLEADEHWGFVSGESIQLAAGDHSVEVRYATPLESDKPRARLNVYWSSDSFALEPLPGDVLFREEVSTADLITHGAKLVDAMRCAACHTDQAAMVVESGPSLDRVWGSQPRSILVERLRNPKTVVQNSRMPSFQFSEEEASQVADFLRSVSKPPEEDSIVAAKKDDRSKGTALLHSLGCAACHRTTESNRVSVPAAPWEAPELTSVGKRRSREWILRWLKDPVTLNAAHRMPKFQLTNDQRRQLAEALSQPAKAEPSDHKPTAESIESGRKLVVQSGCASCHSIPGIKSGPAARSLTSGGWDGSCLQKQAARKPNRIQPEYSLSDAQRKAIETWGNSLANEPQKASSLSITDRGQLLLARKGCVACHDRNTGRGLSAEAGRLANLHPDLAGQSQGLIPPSLTAVGDKLQDDYLATAIAGRQKEKRLPWLHVQMPQFAHTRQDASAILHAIRVADRIPDEADEARAALFAHLDLSKEHKATAAELLLGNRLTGANGFNCVACHKAGSFEPRNVALGTRGSDIMTMGQRIRPRFFQRWMKNPIQVVPGIEMPALKKGVPGILDDSLPRQIGVIWTALSDSRFKAPTVTSNFEQFVTVPPGSSPQVIRDVFTIGLNKDRRPVARALAIGFDHGHNVLLDLDTMQHRLWTVGEFARQRTEGKSWYWDMPGTVIQEPGLRKITIQLANGDERTAVEDEGRFSELLSYSTLDDGVRLNVRSWFDLAEDTASAPSAEPHFTDTVWANPERPLEPVTTRHTIKRYSEAGMSGWEHSVHVLNAPPGARLLLDRTFNTEASDAVQVSSLGQQKPAQGQTGGIRFTTPLPLVTGQLPPDKPPLKSDPESITTTPGLIGTRLPIEASIMPTAMAWLPDGRLVFTSLKGNVWIASDTDNDQLPDSLKLFESGLSAPFGILADEHGIIVAHKPELIRLQDTDDDGRADQRTVVASGWGFNDNYHDWSSGLIKDPDGNMYLGLGSDYSQKTRPANQDRWRGGVIKVDPSGLVTPLGMSMRYPMGLAMDRHGNLFATDNQGVQNTFNEINHIRPGLHYGVPSRHQPADTIGEPDTPALMVPHPWTRSVNSILFLPDDYPVKELRGHGIGCEYDSRFLMRFTVQDVDGVLQGASYRFSRHNQPAGGTNFIGPICSAVSPNGELFIGSIWDSGWQGGRNTGGITRLIPTAKGLPNGIQEVIITPDGFDVQFFRPIAKHLLQNPEHWSLQGYTRKWSGGYASPDSGRYSLKVSEIKTSGDATRVSLMVKDLRPGFLYDISTSGELAKQDLWPAEAHYSVKVIPKLRPGK